MFRKVLLFNFPTILISFRVLKGLKLLFFCSGGEEGGRLCGKPPDPFPT